MKCTNCGFDNEADARFCQRCGTSLGQPAWGPLPQRGRAWWYPIGVWGILAAFFLFLDLAGSGTVSWSVWPVGILGIFLVGFTLLRHAEDLHGRGPKGQGP